MLGHDDDFEDRFIAIGPIDRGIVVITDVDGRLESRSLRQWENIYHKPGVGCAGAFVTQARLDYAIGPRTRFSQNLTAAGHTSERHLLRIETLAADTTERRHLALAKGAQVHVAESFSRSDGVPVAYKRMAFPADRLPGLPQALRDAPSVTAALAGCGIADYQRLWTRLTAERPGAIIARHLHMPETGPVLRSESLDADITGVPVEYGIAWFCSERIQLVVDRSSFL